MAISPPSDEVLERWRADTPGCAHRNHLNNAGAALVPKPVADAVTDYLQEETLHGGYETAHARADQIESAYRSLARLLAAKTSNIAIVENATVATSQALSAFHFEPGDTVLTTKVDYSSNQIMLLNLAQRFGVRVVRAEDQPGGGVDPDSVRSLVRRHRPIIMLMSWVPTNSGLVQDARAVGEICRSAGVPFLLDACQAVGQLPVDVSELHCDFLAATSRKFLRGPRGLGFLYVSDRVLEDGLHPLFPDTHGARWVSADRFRLEDSARRFENWEFSYALVAGLGRAADYALEVGLDTIRPRSSRLAEYARERLGALPGARVLDRGDERCAIVTVDFEGIDATGLVEPLRQSGINTSANRRHHAVLDMGDKGTETNLRVSPHYYNTTEEIDALVAGLQKILRFR